MSENGSVSDLPFSDVSYMVTHQCNNGKYMCFVVIGVKPTSEVVLYRCLMVSKLNPKVPICMPLLFMKCCESGLMVNFRVHLGAVLQYRSH